MEIYKLLVESSEDLYLDDLDYFETELATNDAYSEDYRNQCLELICELRAWKRKGIVFNDRTGDISDAAQPETAQEKKSVTRRTRTGIVVGIHDLAPEDANPVAANMTPSDQVKNDIDAIRANSSYKTLFKKYVKESQIIDQSFLEKHFSYFQQWEVDAIASIISFDEDFLEKYFGAIDREKIARYQLFSESFFIKHYSQMNPEIVLKHGKNEWRKKENRSKQLDVFLRLKGINY